ncbi:hypothetical protein SAMN06298224_1975 [Fibrobacter sp. UWB16]|nr:hypothetical protein SAMN06298224_1975 [Fibrobacter sp. UWB16]
MAGMTSSFKKYREQKKSASFEADLTFRIWIRTNLLIQETQRA